MNTLQLIESIRQVFPGVPRNQIRLDLDTAQKILASETGTLTTRASLSSIATNFAWALPTGFISLKDLVFYDSSDNPKYSGDYNYKYEIELGKLFIYSLTSTPITGLNTEISSAYLHYEKLPDTLTNESTAMEIAEQFRDANESYVLSKYFGKFPIDFVSRGEVVKTINLQLAQWHESRYEKLKIKLKRYFNSLQTTGDGTVQNYQHAGSHILPRRPNDSTYSSTISIPALTELYTKYVYYKITTTGDFDPDIQINYSTISCSVIGDTITLTSTGDFSVGTIINFSNEDCGYTYDSSSQITITAPSGWTNASFEMYERI